MVKRLVFLSILIFTTTLHAQKVRKYSNEFMNIGVDAASMGMANAVVASTDNVNAAYWNPAGLIHLENKQIELMHASYFANIAQYDYAAFAMPIDDKSTVAVSLIRFGVDDIMNTTELIDSYGIINYDKISLFSTADYAFSASYSRALPVKGLSLGVNAKVIRRIIGKFANSWGFGFDLGAQYQTESGLKLGLMARDITTTYNSWAINEKEFAKISNAIPGENSDLPETVEITNPKLDFGLSKKFSISEDFSLLTAFVLNAEFAKTQAVISSKSISVSPALGMELAYTDMIFLRGGLGNFQKILQFDGSEEMGFRPNIGLGFQYKGIQIDYALTDIGDKSVALYSNIFSLKLDFGIFTRK